MKNKQLKKLAASYLIKNAEEEADASSINNPLSNATKFFREQLANANESGQLDKDPNKLVEALNDNILSEFPNKDYSPEVYSSGIHDLNDLIGADAAKQLGTGPGIANYFKNTLGLLDTDALIERNIQGAAPAVKEKAKKTIDTLKSNMRKDMIMPGVISGAGGLAGSVGSYIAARILFNKLFGKKDKKSILRILTELGLGGAGGIAAAGLTHGLYGGNAGSRLALTNVLTQNKITAPWYAQPLTVPSRLFGAADRLGRAARGTVDASAPTLSLRQNISDLLTHSGRALGDNKYTFKDIYSVLPPILKSNEIEIAGE